jgi:hypothetical protein
MNVVFQYGHWTLWADSDGSGGGFGAGGYYGTQKVTFDGPNKIIYVAEGVTVLDIKVDVYSAWKEWVLGNLEYPYGSNWPPAIDAIGGEPLNDTLNVGSTFFLENGWRIQPFASKTPYILTVNGNIYTRETGQNPFLFAEGVSVNLTRSNLVDQLVATAAVTEQDYLNIAEKVWQYTKLLNTGTNSYGTLVKDIDSDLTDVKTQVDKTLKKGEFLALK